jgi:hypothetical protein
MARSPRPTPPQTPPPIQRVQFTKEDFTTDEGVARFNAIYAQHVGATQALQGSGGRTTLFSGLDVQGQTVTGLGAPQGDTDAVSLAHANGNYSAPAVGPQLDIGGPNALKGLTGLYLTFQQFLQAGANGTITLAKLTSGGANGSITVKKGQITAFTNPT